VHDRGKLSFDDDARKYVPELPERDGHRPVLISNLLQHTSGLPDYTEFPEPKPIHPGYLSNEDYVKLIADKPRLVRPRFAAGERYEYSNTNYLLLAVIVERASKRPFGQFMHDEVFAPLGMDHTWVNDHPAAPPRAAGRATVHATGYDRKKVGGWKATWGAPPVEKDALLTAGDGAVWSSADDMVRFDAGMKDGKLLKPATWKLALTPSKTRDGKTNDYGFGWGLELDDKGRVTSYGHEGAWAGFHTAYYRYTGVDRAAVVLSNREDFNVGKAWEQVDAAFAR
jgi:CubicO group peptidase (beta-lactamase class C family)